MAEQQSPTDPINIQIQKEGQNKGFNLDLLNQIIPKIFYWEFSTQSPEQRIKQLESFLQNYSQTRIPKELIGLNTLRDFDDFIANPGIFTNDLLIAICSNKILDEILIIVGQNQLILGKLVGEILSSYKNYQDNQKYLSLFQNPEFLSAHNLQPEEIQKTYKQTQLGLHSTHDSFQKNSKHYKVLLKRLFEIIAYA